MTNWNSNSMSLYFSNMYFSYMTVISHQYFWLLYKCAFDVRCSECAGNPLMCRIFPSASVLGKSIALC